MTYLVVIAAVYRLCVKEPVPGLDEEHTDSLDNARADIDLGA